MIRESEFDGFCCECGNISPLNIEGWKMKHLSFKTISLFLGDICSLLDGGGGVVFFQKPTQEVQLDLFFCQLVGSGMDLDP